MARASKTKKKVQGARAPQETTKAAPREFLRCRCSREFEEESDFRKHLFDTGHDSLFFRREFGTRVVS